MSGRHAGWWIGLLAFVCACGGRTPVEEETGPTPEVRRADISTCHDAMAQAGTQTSNQRVQTIVTACKDLWLDPECRAAWADSLNEPPESRGESVIQRCARSICPTLPAPQPALCAQDLENVDLLDLDPDWSHLWEEFSGVVLGRDLALPKDDAVARLLGVRLLQLVAISGTAPDEVEPPDE